MYRCRRCRAKYKKQPSLWAWVAETPTDKWCKRPGCPKCLWLGYLDRVRVRE